MQIVAMTLTPGDVTMLSGALLIILTLSKLGDRLWGNHKTKPNPNQLYPDCKFHAQSYSDSMRRLEDSATKMCIAVKDLANYQKSMEKLQEARHLELLAAVKEKKAG